MSKAEMSYQTAYDELQQICSQLESEEVDVDQITHLVKRASELVKFCQNKLRNIESELEVTDSPQED